MLPADYELDSNTEEVSIDFRQYLNLLLQWWWAIALVTIVAAAGAYLYSKRITPVYQATTTLMVNVSRSGSPVDYYSIATSEQLAQSYSQLITKRPVMEEVVRQLNLPMSPESLARSITAKLVSSSQLLTVTVRSTNPGLTAAVANTVADVFSLQLAQDQASRFTVYKDSLSKQISDLKTQIDQTRGQLADAKNILVPQQTEIDRTESNLRLYEQIYSNLSANYDQIGLINVQNNTTIDVTQSQRLLEQQMSDTEDKINQTLDQLAAAKNAMIPDQTEVDKLQNALDQSQQAYTNLSNSFEQIRLTEAQSVSTISQIEKALVPSAPISPNVMQNTLLAAMVGLMLSVGGVVVIDLLDDTVKNPEEITRRFKLNVLGAVSQYKEPEDDLITHKEPRSPISESFRALRMNVQYASVDRPVKTLLVTSAAPSDGKTTIAANLGVVFAQNGKKVTVIDADLHRPRMHKVFQTDRLPGLSSLFVQPQIFLNGESRHTQQEHLSLITAGELPPNPSDLLSSNKMREILDAVLDHSDLVIIDTPPVLSLTDAVVLSPLVDGVVLVVRPGQTTFGALKVAVEQLRHVGANILGVVLNEVDHKRARYGYYYKSYYYTKYKYYQQDGKKNENVPVN